MRNSPLDEEDEDESREVGEVGEGDDAPRRSGATGADIVLIGGALLGSLILLGGGFVLCKQLGDLGDDLDIIRQKSNICKNSRAGALPDGLSNSGGTSSLRPETRTFNDGEEPPLQVELRSYTEGKGAKYVRFGSQDVLPAREVTVVNLWATWCHPCVDELPALRSLFERHGSDWAEKARFLPVLTEDQTTVESAFRDFKDKMPAFRRFLVEFGGFTQSLEKKRMWRGDLPVTLVLGCRQRVRWMRFGELGPPEIAEIETTVSSLIAELDSAECRKDVAVCGDNRCSGMENKVTCPRDCPDVIICGDTLCEGPAEDKESCPSDCAYMKCGDDQCGEGETFKNCPQDCRPKCPDDLKCLAGFRCEKNGICKSEKGFMQPR